MGDDLVYGGAGNDGLYAGEGNDTVYGGTGNDYIVGDADVDQLFGGTGDDTIDGGTGNDTLTGGDGADIMGGADDRDTFYGGIGDTIDGGEGGDDEDTLDLTGYDPALINIIYDAGNSENGTVQFLDGSGGVSGTLSFSNIEHVIPCFTPGSLILTDKGEVKVENLVEGDRVMTRDNGFQTIRWVGQRHLSRGDLAAQPKLNPVRIKAGALGGALPLRDMMVSPQHRMLMTGPRAEMFFGSREVLVAATHLVGESGIERVYPREVTYIHILCDQHEVIRADGAWTESFQPGDMTLSGMDQAQRDELLTLFPALAEAHTLYPAARMTLKAHEVRVLLNM